MKKIFQYLFLLAGGSLLLSSCNDFLDREPLDSVTPDNFFFTENDLAAYAVKHYNFTTHEGFNAGIWKNDNATDNQAATDYDNKWIPGQWKVKEAFDNPASNDPWHFAAIREANYFLETVVPRFEKGEIEGTEANIKHYIGEMYFLRAKNYLTKLESFGDFPIIKTILPDEAEPLTAASKREPRNKVARFILEDLDRAIGLLTNNISGGKNRITKNAALLLKSRAALLEASWLTYHRGTALVPGGPGWPGKAEDLEGFNIDTEIAFFLKEAKAAAKEVIGNAALVQNTAKDCMDETVKTDDDKYKMSNPYFAQFSANSLEGYSEVLLWRSYNLLEYKVVHSAPAYIRFGGNTGFTRQLVEGFLCRDGKPIYATSQYKGDESLLDVRKNRDLRLQLFMMTPSETLSPILLNGEPDLLSDVPQLLEINEKRCVTGYQVRKGLSDNWYRDGNTAIEGCPVYRVAEAYLNYIEADCIEHNGTSIGSEAAGYWGDLRERAGLPRDYNVTVDNTDLTQELDWAVYSAGKQVSPLLYNIRRERRCELVAEGLRMMDLKRWRALDQVQHFVIQGVNLWESDLKDKYMKDGKNLLVQEGTEGQTSNVSSYANSGKYLCPYRAVKTNNLMYDAGYSWCEAHYLNPIAITHFRITASNPNDLSTSIIYQNPGWPTVANEGPLGIK